jgi:hypothetical protein
VRAVVGGKGLGSGSVEWVFSGVLVAVSAGIMGYTGYLLWRLFRTEPLTVDAPSGGEPGGE